MIDWTLEDWLKASRAQRSAWVASIDAEPPTGFELSSSAEATTSVSPSPLALALPELRHRATSTEWILVPRHSYCMGLTRNEEAAARAIEDPPPLNIAEMRPAHQVEVAPFLIMKNPISEQLARSHIRLEPAKARPEFKGPEALRPVYLLRGEVESLQMALGFSLPSEEQWEAACRGGTTTLFFFGDELPEDHATVESLVTPDLTHAKPNPLGLFGLFIGEWCRDRWRPSYGKSKPTKDFAVRGGASVFWPWQGSEWSFCVSSMRMPSKDLSGGLCGARFVVEAS